MVHETAKDLIEKKIDLILEGWDFEKRKEKKEECPCFSSKRCHDIGELNCFFCFCPNYDLSKEEGGCKIGNPLEKGRWFSLKEGRIWDCSNCVWPHEKENVKKVLLEIFFGKDAFD